MWTDHLTDEMIIKIIKNTTNPELLRDLITEYTTPNIVFEAITQLGKTRKYWSVEDEKILIPILRNYYKKPYNLPSISVSNLILDRLRIHKDDKDIQQLYVNIASHYTLPYPDSALISMIKNAIAHIRTNRRLLTVFNALIKTHIYYLDEFIIKNMKSPSNHIKLKLIEKLLSFNAWFYLLTTTTDINYKSKILNSLPRYATRSSIQYQLRNILSKLSDPDIIYLLNNTTKLSLQVVLLPYINDADILLKMLLTSKSSKIQKVALNGLNSISYHLTHKTLLRIAKTKKYWRIWHKIIKLLPNSWDHEIYINMIKRTANHITMDVIDLYERIFYKIDDIDAKKEISELLYQKLRSLAKQQTLTLVFRIIKYISLTNEKVKTYLTFRMRDINDYILNSYYLKISNYITTNDIEYIDEIMPCANNLLKNMILSNLDKNIISTLILMTNDPKLIRIYREYL